MRAQPVDLIGGYYKDDSLPWSAQDVVNWLPVVAEVAGTRTVKKFSTPPGLRPWQQIGTGPIRGMHDCEGLRLIVSGRYLYRITTTGTGIPIGVIPGVGRVQMTHNQFKTGFQVLVENGQGGGGYVYTTATDTFAKVTDEGYPGSISSDYLDSYILGVEPQGRFWFHSNLADATDYNTLDRYEAEAAPDRIVGLAVSASEVVVFGQRTTEFYFNSGAATGTFQNRKSSITRGCASRHTIQKLDNTLFWLGDDGVVYRLEGYLARPVSTRPLEKAISGYNWPEAIAYVWEDRGHKVYYLTFPDGQTFGYDVITGLWHRRQSFGMDRWRLSHIISWGRDWYGGDFQNGRIWQIDWDYFLEGDQPIISDRVSPALADDQSQLIVPNAELILDTGQGPGTMPIPFPSQPAPPSITGDAPDGVIGVPYPGFSYVVSAGANPISSVVVSNGSLPPGMILSSSGVIGTSAPSATGTYSYTVRVTDTKGIWAETSDSIKVSPASFLTMATLNQIRVSSTPYNWSNTIPSPPFSVTAAIAAYHDGRLIVASAAGVSGTTTAGASWTPCTGIPGGKYAAILHTNGTWFAIPSTGTTLYKSSDGITFTAQTYTALAGGVANACIAYNKIVIITKDSSAGGARSSDGGLTWTAGGIVSSVPCAVDRNPVTGVLLSALGQGGGPTYRIGRSTDDGASWTYVAAPASSNVVSIRYGRGIWLAVYSLSYACWRSTDDGATWTQVASPAGSTGTVGDFNEFIFDGDRFIICSGDSVQTTIDGSSWVVGTSVAGKTIAVRR